MLFSLLRKGDVAFFPRRLAESDNPEMFLGKHAYNRVRQ